MLQHLWGPVRDERGARIRSPSCKLAAATAAAIAACDGIDGVKDGVIEDPKRCTYDPKALVGTSAGDCGTVHRGGRQRDPQAVGRPAQGGRQLPLVRAAARRRPECAVDQPGHAAPPAAVSASSMDWFRYFLTQDPKFDGNTVTPAAYRAVLGSVGGAVRDRHRHRQSGPDGVPRSRRQGDRLARLGRPADHRRGHASTTTRACSSRWVARRRRRSSCVSSWRPASRIAPAAPGPQPTGQLEALLTWVEDGKAPETLPADAPRSDRSGHALAAAVRVSARREVQGQRQHGRRGQLHVQQRVLSGRVSVHPDAGRHRRRRSGRSAARPSAAPERHRFRHRREPQPRVRHRSRAGRRPRAGNRGPAERDGRRCRTSTRAGCGTRDSTSAFRGGGIASIWPS